MKLTFPSLLEDLKNGKFQPVYFLHGNEPYFIDAVTAYIENEVLSDGEKAFNQTVLYGKEVDFKQVVDAARRYPMMAPRQVVIVKEAQEMRSLKELAGYVAQPSPTTLLLICHKHKRFDGRSSFAKTLKKHAVVFESKKLYDNQLPDWIRQYLRSKGFSIAPDATALMAEYLGTDLSKVVNELDKMAINLPTGSTISVQQVQENIGISKDFNVFELQKAIGFRQVSRAQRIVHYFAANPRKNPMAVILGSLYNYFSKVFVLHGLLRASETEKMRALKLSSGFFLKEYQQTARNYSPDQLRRIFSILKTYDLRSKGVENNLQNNPEGALLREMVFKMMNV